MVKHCGPTERSAIILTLLSIDILSDIWHCDNLLDSVITVTLFQCSFVIVRDIKLSDLSWL